METGIQKCEVVFIKVTQYGVCDVCDANKNTLNLSYAPTLFCELDLISL